MATIDSIAPLECLPPGVLEEGLLETKVDDAGEVGSPRRRNRFTRALERFSFTRVVTDAEKEALRTFYDTTLNRGVEAFNWTHPYTSVVYEVVLPERPKIKHRMRGYWTIEVELEEI